MNNVINYFIPFLLFNLSLVACFSSTDELLGHVELEPAPEPDYGESPEVYEARKKMEEKVKEALEDNLVDLDKNGLFPGGDLVQKDDMFDLDIGIREVKVKSAIGHMQVIRVQIQPNISTIVIELLQEKRIIVDGLCRITRGKTAFGNYDGSGSCRFTVVKLKVTFSASFTEGQKSYPGIDDLHVYYKFSDIFVKEYPNLRVNGKEGVNDAIFSIGVKWINAWVHERLDKFGQPYIRQFLEPIFKRTEGFYKVVSAPARKPDEL